MANVAAEKLEYLSRRFRVEARDDGHMRLHVVGERGEAWRKRRRLVRSIAFTGPAVLIAAKVTLSDTALQWLAAASLGALLVAYGMVREMPSRALFVGPLVDMVRASLEVATEGEEGGYRGGREATTVSVDGVPIATVRLGDADPAQLRVLRVRTEVFMVTPGRAIFVDQFRDPDDAVDFAYYLSMALGVSCEERGMVPVVRGLPWEPPKSHRRERRPYGSGGQGVFAVLLLGAAVAFAISHVLAPAKTPMELGFRCAAYVVFDYVVQDILFVRWVRRHVESTLREAAGWLPK